MRRREDKKKSKVKRNTVLVNVFVPMAETHDLASFQQFGFPRKVLPVDVVRTVLTSLRDQLRQLTGGITVALTGKNFEDFYLTPCSAEGDYDPTLSIQRDIPLFDQISPHNAMVAIFEDPLIVQRNDEMMAEREAAIQEVIDNHRREVELQQKRASKVQHREEKQRQDLVNSVLHCYQYEEQREQLQQQQEEAEKIAALTAKSKGELQAMHKKDVKRLAFINDQRWQEMQKMFMAEMESKLWAEATRRLAEDKVREERERKEKAVQDAVDAKQREGERMIEREIIRKERNICGQLAHELDEKLKRSVQQREVAEEIKLIEEHQNLERIAEKAHSEHKRLQVEMQITALKRRAQVPTITTSPSGRKNILGKDKYGNTMQVAVLDGVPHNLLPTDAYPGTDRCTKKVVNNNISLQQMITNQLPGIQRTLEGHNNGAMAFDSFEAIRRADRKRVLDNTYMECEACTIDNPIAHFPAHASTYIIPRMYGVDAKDISPHNVNGYQNVASRDYNAGIVAEGTTGRPIPQQAAIYTFNPRMPPLHRLPPKSMPPGAAIELGAPTTFVRVDAVPPITADGE